MEEIIYKQIKKTNEVDGEIKKVTEDNKKIKEAFPPMSITIQLEDELDISRGDMLVRENNMPTISQDIDLMICWMNKKKLHPNKKYIVR